MKTHDMEYCEKNLNKFNVIYSEKRCDSNTHTPTAFSSCSSTSSNSSFLDTHRHNIQNITSSTPIPLIDQIDLEISSIQQRNCEERRKKLNKRKDKQLIPKYQIEEMETLHAIALSKCGRFVKYDIKIGEGGYKIVYKGFDKESCRSIAWCEVKGDHVDGKQKNQATLKEIDIMLKLDHPNVVKCYAVLKEWYLIRPDNDGRGCEGRGLVIIEEFMGSGTLKEMIKKNFQDGFCILDMRLITSWLRQILDVLRYMHCRIQPPIIHRDVKSENCFLVEQSGEEHMSVKLGDFGLATTINQNSQRKTMIGTVGFMAPEVYAEKYDNKVDIYAFGMMVLEVMTNKTPYDDCKNVFQVISKSMGTDVTALIATVAVPFIKEIVMACVHPHPNYRPSAEELCEHPIFQNASLIVEPVIYGGNRSQAISELVHNLSNEIKSPIINIIIHSNPEFVHDKFHVNTIIFSLDVYLARNSDLSLLMEVVKSTFEDESNKTVKETNQLKKLYDSICLQVRYVVKLVNGERWRRIFEEFLLDESMGKRSQRSNSTPTQIHPMSDVDKRVPSSSLNFGNKIKYSNTFTEYSHTVAIYHRATAYLDLEIENYCSKADEKKRPYFFNFCTQNKQATWSLKEYNKLTAETNGYVGKPSPTDNPVESPTMAAVSANDEVFTTPYSNQKDSSKRYVKAEIFSSADVEIESSVNFLSEEDFLHFSSSNQQYFHNLYSMDQYSNVILETAENTNAPYINYNLTFPPIGRKNNLLQQNQPKDVVNSSVSYDNFQYSRHNEPSDVCALNSPLMNQIYPTRKNLPSESNFALSEAPSFQPHYSPHTSCYSDQSLNTGYLQNFISPAGIRPINSRYLQQQSQNRINYNHSGFVSGPSHLILSPQHPYFPQNLSGIYYNKAQVVDPESKFMQGNAPYLVPSDQSSRNPNSMPQPVLTRSLPSIVGSVPAPLDNIIVSEMYQSYVTSAATMTRTPMSIGGGTSDGRQGTISNYSQNQHVSQKFIPPVISTSRPIAVRPQSSYSTVIPSTKITDKSKKKNKSRNKCKYLLKVINIQESVNPGETILTFEMMVPMHQMRFTCSLSNEINTLDVSKSVVASGQIPGELRKKDILESLVNTVKKICQNLSEDINSISLNEEYVFHPFIPYSGLLKVSDYLASIPTSFDSDVNQLSTPSNTNLSIQSQNNVYNSCTSSRSLSRHPSNDDVSLSIGNLSMAMSDQTSNNVTENDLILFCENESIKPILFNTENQKNVDLKPQTIVSAKCTCPVSDSTLKVPEYIFSTVKQIVDKLLSLNCKGLIILPQSNDLLTRNFRVLEIPADHMFVGLPCSDSSYNVIKGQKDKDFIIAKDTRDPENVTEKCVYQKPSDGAVLLDSSGEIQYIQKPSLIIPSKPGHGNEKTDVKELPSELTHNKDVSMDCDQIVTVLQSLVQIQSNAYQSKDELFDSPVLLEPVRDLIPKQQGTMGGDKPEGLDYYPRRGSDESVVTQAQGQSQIQVERIFCQYVALPKGIDSRHDETLSILDNNDRDLPRHQIRSRKISTESIDSLSAIRTRATSTISYVNEADLIQASTGFQKIPTNNPQKSIPLGTLINPMPIQRMPTVAGSVSAPQYLLTNQNPSNSMSGNIFIQNIQNVPLYSSSSQSSAVAASVKSQSNNSTLPIVLPGQNSIGLNFSHILPSQVVIPSAMTQCQISQLHQMQQNPNQRMPVPSSMSTASLSSSQLISMIPVSQQGGLPTPNIHPAQMSSMPQGSHVVAEHSEQSFPGLSRQIPLTNVRQLPTGSSSQYYDSNVINSVLADNLRLHLMNHTLNAQSQPHPLLLIPHNTSLGSSITQSNNAGPMVPGASPKVSTSDPVVFLGIPENVQSSDSDSSKPKAEQTIGRFVIRPVIDSTENS